MASVPPDRRGQLDVLLGMVRLLLARQRMNLPAAAEEAQRLRVVADAPDTAPLGLSEELRALALVNLGITEYWGGRLAEAEPHLEQGITLARRIARPYLEFLGLAHRTSIATVRSSPTRWRKSAPGRRSNWPGGTAGPTSLPPASPT